MKTILIAAALLCSVEVRAMAESTLTFEADAVGATPKGWTATKTGRGDPRGTIELFEVEDATFRDAGKIGLWTKADSVTLFDAVIYGTTR
jgi:hypothetical protein